MAKAKSKTKQEFYPFVEKTLTPDELDQLHLVLGITRKELAKKFDSPETFTDGQLALLSSVISRHIKNGEASDYALFEKYGVAANFLTSDYLEAIKSTHNDLES